MHRNRKESRKSSGRSNPPTTPSPPPPTPVMIPHDESPSFKEYLRTESELSWASSKAQHVMIPGTLVYSPFFIRPLVTLVSLGTREKTAEEISVALRIPLLTSGAGDDGAAFHSFCQTQQNVATHFTKFHNEHSNCHFLESRSFWIKKGFEIGASFLENFLASFPSASFHEIEFCDSVAAAARMNCWVSKETGHGIENVMKQRDVNEFTRIVLLHAIHFCGNWKKPFPLQNTKLAKFKLSAKRSVETAMMNRSGKFLYGEFPNIDAIAVALPFYKESLYFVIILPKSGTNLDKLRMRGLPNPILKSMKEWTLSVSLPRFTIQSHLHLIPLLHHIGIKSMFDPTSADFSDITGYIPGGSGLFVTDVIQVVKIEVNEGSNVARPPTPPQSPGRGSKSVGKGGPPRRSEEKARSVSPGGGSVDGSKPFMVDHPFIFQVIDKKSWTLLIDGTCMDPSVVGIP